MVVLLPCNKLLLSLPNSVCQKIKGQIQAFWRKERRERVQTAGGEGRGEGRANGRAVPVRPGSNDRAATLSYFHRRGKGFFGSVCSSTRMCAFVHISSNLWDCVCAWKPLRMRVFVRVITLREKCTKQLSAWSWHSHSVVTWWRAE